MEQGVTNELFLTERDETQACLFNKTPEDVTTLNATKPTDVSSDVVKFAIYIRFLAPPIPVPDTPSIARGRDSSTRSAARCATRRPSHRKVIKRSAESEASPSIFGFVSAWNGPRTG